MEFRIERLGPNFKKQEQPACACCGYDADWIIRVGAPGERGTIERMLCDMDWRDALLDALNFSTFVPDSIPA